MHVKNGINAYSQEAGFLTNFSEEERTCIVPTTHKTMIDGANISIAQGGVQPHIYIQEIRDSIANRDEAKYIESTDKIFILDIIELHDYILKKGFAYQKVPTKKAVQMCPEPLRGQLSTLTEACYWLRTPRVTETNVLNDGASVRIKFYNDLILNQDVYDGSIGVVPAMYIKADVEINSGVGTIQAPYKFKY